MSQWDEQETIALAKALVEIVPRVERRIRTDVPFVCETTDAESGLREVSKLRATPGQLSLLRVLIEQERCTMQELAAYLTVAPSTVTAMVKRLLALGYVERSRDDVDWRAVWVAPSERGRQVVAIFNHESLTSLQRRLKRLSEEEQRSLAGALPALRHLIEE